MYRKAIKTTAKGAGLGSAFAAGTAYSVYTRHFLPHATHTVKLAKLRGEPMHTIATIHWSRHAKYGAATAVGAYGAYKGAKWVYKHERQKRTYRKYKKRR